MGEKQKVSHTDRIQTHSIADLSEGLTKARMRLNRRGIKHRKRKLKDGPLINALVAWYLARTEDDQAKIAIEGLARFEAMLEGEDCSVPAIDGGTAVVPLIADDPGDLDRISGQGDLDREDPRPETPRRPKRRTRRR